MSQKTFLQNAKKLLKIFLMKLVNLHRFIIRCQQTFKEAFWMHGKNVISSSIALQQEYAIKAGVNFNMPEETIKAIQHMMERATTAFQNENKIVFDSTETSKRVFDAFSENTKIFASLNKNIMELMASGMKKYV